MLDVWLCLSIRQEEKSSLLAVKSTTIANHLQDVRHDAVHSLVYCTLLTYSKVARPPGSTSSSSFARHRLPSKTLPTGGRTAATTCRTSSTTRCRRSSTSETTWKVWSPKTARGRTKRNVFADVVTWRRRRRRRRADEIRRRLRRKTRSSWLPSVRVTRAVSFCKILRARRNPRRSVVRLRSFQHS
jgi:hypothetical protein